MRIVNRKCKFDEEKGVVGLDCEVSVRPCVARCAECSLSRVEKSRADKYRDLCRRLLFNNQPMTCTGQVNLTFGTNYVGLH